MTPTKLLLIEDNPGDARLVQAALAEDAPGEFELSCVARLADALARIRSGDFDLVLSDLGLPDSRGLAAVEAIATCAPALPLVVLTGTGDEDLGCTAIRKGAQDYLVKGKSSGALIARTLHYALERKRLENALSAENETLEQRVAERRAELQQTSDALRDSEARFRSLTAMSSDFYWESDAEHRLTRRASDDTKESTVKLFRSGAQIGQKRWDIPHVSPDAAGWAAHRAVLEAHQPFRGFELSRLGDDGSERYLSISGDPVFDAAGRFSGYRGVGSDITERRRAEADLHAREARYRAVADSATDAFVTGGAAGRIVGWNPAATRLFGYAAAEILGQPLTLLLPPRFEEAHRAGIQRLLSGSERRLIGKAVELAGRRQDGSEFPLELSLAQWTVAEGTFFTGIIRDLSERKAAEAKIGRLTRLYTALSQCNEAIVRCASAEALFPQICRVAVESGGFKLARILLADAGARSVRVAAGFGEGGEDLQGLEISLDPASPMGRGPTAGAIRENRPVWCQDFMHDPAAAPWHERGARLGWGAVAALPLHRDGVVVGAFAVIDREAQAFDAAARNLLTEMATDIDFALENYARAADLRAAEEQFRGLVEQSIAGIFILQENKLVYVNPRAAEIVGQGSADELIGSDPLRWIVAADRGEVEQNLRRLLEGEAQSVAMEFGVLHKTGAVIQVGANGARATHQGRPAIIGMVQDISEKKRAEAEIQRYIEQLRTAFMSTVEVATTLTELRDPYTAGHERRVGEIAAALGAELGLDAQRIEGLRVAGYLHDIGKITIPAEILSKPGKLTAIEFQLIQGHPHSGYEVLSKVEFPWPVAQIALQHHERIDGSGYPRGLKGEAILLDARILAVADVVEAISSHRPYRAALGLDQALAEIERGRGSAYDAAAADACLRLFREKGYAIPA